MYETFYASQFIHHYRYYAEQQPYKSLASAAGIAIYRMSNQFITATVGLGKAATYDST